MNHAKFLTVFYRPSLKGHKRSLIRNSIFFLASSCGLPVNHGVPQGSVLGPLLFLLLVNDFSSLDEVLLYADDTTLMTEGAMVGEVEEAAM